jgi:solute carrier family 35 protein E3
MEITKNAEVAFWIGLSIASSTALILLMKLIKFRLNCRYTTTLSTFHFLATWLLLEFLAFFGTIRRIDQVTFWRKLLLAFLVMCSIVSMNFNLAANSIGFYQMSKLCCIPYMLIYTFFFKGQRYTNRELISLVILLTGVAVFSVSDVEFNTLGSIYAIIAVTSTAHNQMLTGELQKQFSVSGSELQLAIMPEEFALGVVSSTILENIGPDSFARATFGIWDIVLVLCTCFFAIGVNVATFSLIGRTSSVTYQVVGHAKTILLLILGYVFFPSPWESKQQMLRAVLGIVVALIGVFMYSRVRLDIQKEQQRLEEDRQPFLINEDKK